MPRKRIKNLIINPLEWVRECEDNINMLPITERFIEKTDKMARHLQGLIQAHCSIMSEYQMESQWNPDFSDIDKVFRFTGCELSHKYCGFPFEGLTFLARQYFSVKRLPDNSFAYIRLTRMCIGRHNF